MNNTAFEASRKNILHGTVHLFKEIKYVCLACEYWEDIRSKKQMRGP